MKALLAKGSAIMIVRENNKNKYQHWVIPALIIIFVFFIRFRLLDFPLERDEGEFAYLGQLILQGIPPYQMAYDIKLPGIYWLYALIMSLFGQTCVAIHFGLLLINCATIILLFFITKKLLNACAALFSSGTYTILSLSSSVNGFAAHATHFVIFFVLSGILLLIKAIKNKQPLTSFETGFLFG